MPGHSDRKRGYSYQSFGRNYVWSRTYHRRGIPHAFSDPSALCKLLPLLCPPTKPTTKDQDPAPGPTPPIKGTPNTPAPPSATITSSVHTEAPSPTPSSPPPLPPPPPPPTTNSRSPTQTPTVISATDNSSSSVPSTTESTNLNSSSEPSTATARQSSNSSPISVSDSTHTVILTNSNGQLTTKEVVSTVPVPFTTSSGIPLIRTTDSLGSTFTVPYGPDPTQTSTIAGSASGTSNTSATVNGAAAKGSDNDIGAVVGGILGGIALLVILILGFCFISRRRRAIRTAPSSEFLGQQQYPFSGSAQFQFQRAGSFGSSAEVVDTPSPVRELGPDPFGIHGEKAAHTY